MEIFITLGFQLQLSFNMYSYHHRLDDWVCFMAMLILENSVYDAGLYAWMRSCTNAFHDWHVFKRVDWSVFVMQPCIRKCWLLENFEKHLPDNGLSFILCFHASLVFEPTFRITVMLRKVCMKLKLVKVAFCQCLFYITHFLISMTFFSCSD